MLFYLTLSGGKTWGISPFPAIDFMDKPAEEEACFLLPGLPLGVWQPFLRRIQAEGRNGKEEAVRWLKGRVGRDGGDWTWHSVDRRPDNLGNQEASSPQNSEFLERLRGRQLTEDELEFFGKSLGLGEKESLQLAHGLTLKGQAEWLPAVEKTRWGWRCRRCGESNVQEWPTEFGMGATCPTCAELGKSTSLLTLFRDCRNLVSQAREDETQKAEDDGADVRSETEVCYVPAWSLNEAQNAAAQEVLAFYRNPGYTEGLLWAACGAGKTEVCFPMLAEALKDGKGILFAAPRRDVIHDVAPRFAQNFPRTRFQILSGVVAQKLQSGHIVLATTHQVLRFYAAFDLVVLDEMDAFPYKDDAMLQWGLNHALKKDGKLLCLTATPTAEALERAGKGKTLLIDLPARHHRHPLPVPVWRRRKVEEPFSAGWPEIREYILKLTQLGPTLVFVPCVSWVSPWVKRIKEGCRGLKVSGTYGADPQRAEKIQGLKEGHWQVFVSTSVLERSVTITGVQVIVLAADHPVFDERTLVQMAGRAGRTREQPNGEVLFLSARRTVEIQKAIRQIRRQNARAKALRLVD